MNFRGLGSGALVSSAIGLGTEAFTGTYGPVTTRECDRVIRTALDLGITMFDTADFYLCGEVERLLGKSLAERRETAIIATCGGVRVDGAGKPAAIDGSPQFLGMACDASLRRLGTDHIDLFYLYRVDPGVPVEDSIGKLAEFVTAGKIRYVGLRAASASQLYRAQATHPISTLAVEYSLLDRSAETESMALAAELGVGIVACCPLGRGLLTGHASATAPECYRAALRVIETEAAELDLGTARLALAWLLASRDDVVPIPSTRSPAHIEMNASVPRIRLSADTCARLAQIFPGTL